MAVELVEESQEATGLRGLPKPLGLKQAFVEWLFTPLDEREHKTMGAWAQAHEVARETLWRWKNGDPEVLTMLKEWRRMLDPAWPSIAATLVSIATDKDHPQVVQAGRTVAELFEKFPDKRVKIDHQVTVSSVYAAAAAALESGDVIEGEVEEAR